MNLRFNQQSIALPVVVAAVLLTAGCASVPPSTREASVVRKYSAASKAPSRPRQSAPKLDPVLNVSADCQAWETKKQSAIGPSGFIRKDGLLIYNDDLLGLVVSFPENARAARDVLYSDRSRKSGVFTASPRNINLFEKAPASYFNPEELATATLTTEWLVLLLEDRTKLVAPIRGRVCESAPDARFIDCELGSFECSLNPAPEPLTFEEAKTKSFECIDRLSLRKNAKLKPVKLACDYFRSSVYEEKLRIVLAKAALCGASTASLAEKLPSLRRVEDACADVESAIAELKSGWFLEEKSLEPAF